ncbi:MAG: hypothetical protein AAFY71_08000 [Bacteroidota bacterium]
MIKQIVIGLLALGVTLLCCEFFVRYSGIGMVSTSNFDPEIGKVNRTSLDFLMFNEGMGMGTFNEFGYLGKAYPKDRSPQTLRLALLGDSYVAGMQVMERHHFRSLLEDQLSEALKQKVEVLNFGMPGADLEDCYCVKENLVNGFAPDYYLFFVSAFDFFPKHTDPLSPKVSIENGKAIVDNNFPQAAIDRYESIQPYIQNSALVDMMRKGTKKTKSVPLASILFDKVYTWFAPPVDMSESSEAYDFSSYPEIIPAMIGTLDPSQTIFVNRNKEPLPAELKELLTDFPFIDVSTVIAPRLDSVDSPISWPITNRVGHWNLIGHQLVADQLTKELQPIIKQ